MIEMNLAGLGFDPKSMSPIVLLKDFEERLFLPIWIGMFEAAAIAMELQNFKPPRPMTHDLLANVIGILGAKVVRTVVSEIVDSTFHAVIEIAKEDKADNDNDLIRIDARPSDAIAISVRTSAPIYVSESVMVKAKMVNSEKDEEETKRYKDFIDEIDPEDFKKYYENQ